MSFYSSLVLFYPGEPPVISPGMLHRLGSELSQAMELESKSMAASVEVKYGRKIDRDYKTTNVWVENKKVPGAFYHQEYKWDVRHKAPSWAELPTDWAARPKNIYRAHVYLGALSREGCESVGKEEIAGQRSGIHPYDVSISIDPVCPGALGKEETVCTGLVAVTISGPGYFSWGTPWKDFAEQYARAKPIVEAKRVTRALFPVRRDALFDRIAHHLGETFLNRSCYQEGDWILSISETG